MMNGWNSHSICTSKENSHAFIHSLFCMRHLEINNVSGMMISPIKLTSKLMGAMDQIHSSFWYPWAFCHGRLREMKLGADDSQNNHPSTTAGTAEFSSLMGRLPAPWFNPHSVSIVGFWSIFTFFLILKLASPMGRRLVIFGSIMNRCFESEKSTPNSVHFATHQLHPLLSSSLLLFSPH